MDSTNLHDLSKRIIPSSPAPGYAHLINEPPPALPRAPTSPPVRMMMMQTSTQTARAVGCGVWAGRLRAGRPNVRVRSNRGRQIGSVGVRGVSKPGAQKITDRKLVLIYLVHYFSHFGKKKCERMRLSQIHRSQHTLFGISQHSRHVT